VSVKAIMLQCDYCYAEESVDFATTEEEEPEFLDIQQVPEHWFHVEGEGDERDYCSRECLINDLS
jgi:hypothetical protein